MTAAGTAADRLAEVRARIDEAARRSGRDPSGVRLVVVTKDVSADRVREAVAAGATDLGENRAQELERKMDELAGIEPAPRWHFIGTLQRNKVRQVAGRVAMIHSIDSAELGRAVAERAAAAGETQDALLEVNVSGEVSKHGLAPAETWSVVASLAGVPGIRLRGLMTIAPAGVPSEARAAFRGLRELQDRLRSELGGGGLGELSMGMTGDFEAAVEEGATIVRIGTAVFGPRER